MVLQQRWEQMQVVLGLPDCQTVVLDGPVLVTPKQRTVLQRYLHASEDLRSSTIFDPATPIGYKAAFTQAGIQEVSRNHPSREAVRGFSVLFRQFYANDEPASFQNALGIAIRTIGELDVYLAWGRAAGRLRAKFLHDLVLE